MDSISEWNKLSAASRLHDFHCRDEILESKAGDLYQVEKILKEKTTKGQQLVLVKWAGYEKPSWVLKSSVQAVPPELLS